MSAKVVGRPSKYTEKAADEICADIAKGVTLAEICRRPGMPDRTTVYDWMKTNDAFSQRIARAREVGFDAIAEEILDIADDATNDWMLRQIEDLPDSYVPNTEHIQRSKLRIEARLKLLAKWDPRRYGDRVTQEHTGEGGGPLQVFINKPG